MRPKSKESADQAVGYSRVLLAVGVDSAEWEAGRLVTPPGGEKAMPHAFLFWVDASPLSFVNLVMM